MTEPRQRPQPPMWLSTLALAMVLYAPVPAFLHHHDWPSMGGDSLVLAMLCLLLAAGIQLIPGARSPQGIALFFGAAIGLFADVQFQPSHPLWLLLIYGIAFVLAMILQPHTARIVALIFAVILTLNHASNLWQRQQLKDTALGDSNLPPVVHLVLDEHIGLAGIPNDVAGGIETQQRIRNVYLSRSFRIYERAYSSHYNTPASLASLLDAKDRSVEKLRRGERVFGSIRSASVLSSLIARGYQLRIYQTDWLDLCSVPDAKPTSCYSYDVWGVNGVLSSLNRRIDRVRYIALVLAQRSWVVHRVKWTLREWIYRQRLIRPPGWGLNAQRPGPLATIPALERLRIDAQQSPRGTVFLAHLLHPHGPFVYDDQCRVKPVGQWKDRIADNMRKFDPVTRKKWYGEYLDQVRCATQMFAELFDELEGYPGFEDAVYVVHGDHGSRIAIEKPSFNRKERLTTQDLMDSYSTLLAIRAPSVDPGIESNPTGINHEIAKLWNVEYEGSSIDDIWLIPEGRDTTIPASLLWPSLLDENFDSDALSEVN